MKIKLSRLINKKYKTEIILFLLGFGLSLAYALSAQTIYGESQFVSDYDARVYLREAYNIVNHGVFSTAAEAPFAPDNFRTPLYPLFIAFFLYFKMPILFVIIVQNFIAGLIAIVTYRIGLKIFELHSVGVIASLLFIFEPASKYWNSILMSDTLFAFLFLVSVYFLINHRIYLSAICLGLATLTRPIGLYFIVIFLLAFSIYQFLKARHYADVLKKIVLASVLFLLVLSPWLGRNKKEFGTFDISGAGLHNFYTVALSQFAAQQNVSLSMPTEVVMVNNAYDYDPGNDAFYKENAYDIISQRPVQYARFYLVSVMKIFNDHDYDYMFHQLIDIHDPSNAILIITRSLVGIGKFIWIIVYALALAGFGFIVANRLDPIKKDWAFLILFLIVYNSLLVGISGVYWGGRLNMPILPLLFCVAAYGFIGIYKLFCLHKKQFLDYIIL